MRPGRILTQDSRPSGLPKNLTVAHVPQHDMGNEWASFLPKGPSTKYLRFLVPTINCQRHGYLDPLGHTGSRWSRA